MRNNNWHGWIGNDDIGSIKTKLKGCGTAQLNFGNCYERGITQVTLDQKLIGTAFNNTISKIIEFDFEDGAILELQELNTGIIVFNNLAITKCKSCPHLHKGNKENIDKTYNFTILVRYRSLDTWIYLGG